MVNEKGDRRLLVVVESVRNAMGIARQGIWQCQSCANHYVWKTRNINTKGIDRECSKCSKRVRVTLDRSKTGQGRKRMVKIWERDVSIDFLHVKAEVERRNKK